MNRVTRRRVRWIAVASLAGILLAGVVVWRLFSTHHLDPWQFLAHVVQVEQTGTDEYSVQTLGWSLAILGRDDEVRAINFRSNFNQRPSTVEFDALKTKAVPWDDGIRSIAASQRVVLMMEDHFYSKHREFIGATLPAFKDEGFTHYAAEAIGPLDASFAQRGYPISRTGLYTSDPQFGNTLRRAIDLDSQLWVTTFVRPLMKSGRSSPLRSWPGFWRMGKQGMLVHAGHSHVLKYKTEYGQRWLAARLWEEAGIEPFTIWQWSSRHDAIDYATIVRMLKGRGVSLKEPVLLMPPPASYCGFQDAPYGLAQVDAIVIHPPDESAAPAKRTVLFPDNMRQLEVAGLAMSGQSSCVLTKRANPSMPFHLTK